MIVIQNAKILMRHFNLLAPLLAHAYFIVILYLLIKDGFAKRRKTEQMEKQEAVWTHHFIDLLYSHGKTASLEARGEEGVQQRSVVYSLIKIITSDLWHVLWESATLFQNSISGPGEDLICHTYYEERRNSTIWLFISTMWLFESNFFWSWGLLCIIYCCFTEVGGWYQIFRGLKV